MILVWLLVIPVAAGLAAWVAGRWSAPAARWISLAAFAAGLALVIAVWMGPDASASPCVAGYAEQGSISFDRPWIPEIGVRFHLALDGLSLPLLALAEFLGLISVACSWKGITRGVGAFHACVLWSVAGIIGVFLAMDLFLFYFFWELMLVPLYFLIAVWGHEGRRRAAIKFFIFTQAGGLVMLVGILGLYFVHRAAGGTYTFDYSDLLGTRMSASVAWWLMLAFFTAFAVKLPALGLHTWLPDAHTEAPTAGSVILAGLVLKAGAYGLVRFIGPLFPQAAAEFAPAGQILGVAAILYGAVLAFAQTDLKRLVAYTSVSHMGFVMLGVFIGNEWAMQGAVMQMLCHGVSTGALFVLAGDLQDRIGTRELDRMGGLWTTAPRMGGIATLFALASMGLPGLGNFVAEFLVLLGTWQVSAGLAAVTAAGMIASVIYALWMIQRVFHGPNERGLKIADLSPRETVIVAAMIAVIVWLGVYPQPVLDTVRPALEAMTSRDREVAGILPGIDYPRPHGCGSEVVVVADDGGGP